MIPERTLEAEGMNPNQDIKLTKELPPALTEHIGPGGYSRPIREAADPQVNEFNMLAYYCTYCGGWVEGQVEESYEDTLGRYSMAGRKGIVFGCKRCGRELGFVGVIS